jgi:hypothetical protein
VSEDRSAATSLQRACEAALALARDPEAAARLDERDVQLLLGAAVRLYGARADDGAHGPAFATEAPELTPSATDVVLAATAMLKASQIELFELGMWQAWSGAAQ